MPLDLRALLCLRLTKGVEVRRQLIAPGKLRLPARAGVQAARIRVLLKRLPVAVGLRLRLPLLLIIDLPKLAFLRAEVGKILVVVALELGFVRIQVGFVHLPDQLFLTVCRRGLVVAQTAQRLAVSVPEGFAAGLARQAGAARAGGVCRGGGGFAVGRGLRRVALRSARSRSCRARRRGAVRAGRGGGILLVLLALRLLLVQLLQQFFVRRHMPTSLYAAVKYCPTSSCGRYCRMILSPAAAPMRSQRYNLPSSGSV